MFDIDFYFCLTKELGRVVINHADFDITSNHRAIHVNFSGLFSPAAGAPSLVSGSRRTPAYYIPAVFIV
ncbi:hypothetical protein EB796_022380 [Bugula neritina]|uniref:Uncharacterized protein n=1 Tax=Bugula neritina TaxID=10212 RepID=A0A7J7J0T9_BUGNE|nr:hypothetical protein EB796_022380 [Bugula neritina]